MPARSVVVTCRSRAGPEQSHAVQELTNDRLGAEADLNRLLGTLRYLQSLKTARQQAEAAAATSQEDTPEQQSSPSTTQGQNVATVGLPAAYTSAICMCTVLLSQCLKT